MIVAIIYFAAIRREEKSSIVERCIRVGSVRKQGLCKRAILGFSDPVKSGTVLVPDIMLDQG
jgi:hypothetical protein